MASRTPPFQRWLEARMPRGGEIALAHRNIYILPTRFGLMYAAALAVLLVASINYSISLGYVLTFLLGGTGVVSILHGYRNLAGLRLRPGKAEPVFAGQPALFRIWLDNPDARERPAICVQAGAHEPQAIDLPAGHCDPLSLLLPTQARGICRLGRLQLYSRFPLGLFRAWSWLELDSECLVYPAPETGAVPLPEGVDGVQAGAALQAGQDDFSGLRGYRLGDSPRHIAWKAVARGSVWLTKEFAGPAGGTVWLDWDALPGLEDEARLSRLCRWVLDADAAGRAYGLRLAGQEIGPAGGELQRLACLAALARFRLPPRGGGL
ncbi:MAG: DUF58 domain-containing protein [Burkholderiales bacterium]